MVTSIVEIAAAAAAAVSGAALVVSTARPPMRLDRLFPSPDLVAPRDHGPVGLLVGRLQHALDSRSDSSIELRLRQARMFEEAGVERRVEEYRARQLRLAGAGAGTGAVLGTLFGVSAPTALALVALGVVWGAALWRGRMDKAIEQRRVRLRIELYTVNQLLSMRVRVGGGVISAVRSLVQRGRGAVVDDLREVLQLHRSGVAAGEAFRRIAASTPEPHAERTYLLLATAEERGADLADALLALSHDIRDDRREALRRSATRKRATALFPIVGLLAPILVMFVAAPLPWIVFGELR